VPPASLEKVRRALVSFSIPRGETVVVAVSGGPDSICLLHFLKKLAPSFSISLHVAHFNHGFRVEAAKEARFVAQLAEAWGLSCSLSEASVLEFCRKKGLSKQAGGRILRYRFLCEVAQKRGACWIATGHTADDQAETFLMRMIRGSGTRGLSGIPALRAHREDGFSRGARIVRPLLHLSREEILQTLAACGLGFVEDPSNRKTDYFRNKVRHQLLPRLEVYNPRIKSALCREAALLNDENDFLEAAASSALSSLEMEIRQDELSYDIQKLARLHPAIRRRVFLRGLEHLHEGLEEAKEVGFRHIEILQGLLDQAPGSVLNLPGGLLARRSAQRLFLAHDRPQGRSSAEVRPAVEVLKEAGSCSFPKNLFLPDWGLSLRLTLLNIRALGDESPGVTSPCLAFFDFDKLSFPLSVRAWQKGDRFAPLGMGGHHKKLQDYFVDIKLPRQQRAKLPLLVSPEGILWIVGQRTDEYFRLTPETCLVLKVAVTQGPDSDREA